MAKEYIERGAVLEKQIGVVVYDEGGWDANVRAVPVEDIEAIPAADVVKVKHSRWIKVGGDIHSSGYTVSCANCGKYHFVHYRGSLGGLYGHDELFEEPSQCPNCGAKMDGGAENG